MTSLSAPPAFSCSCIGYCHWLLSLYKILSWTRWRPGYWTQAGPGGKVGVSRRAAAQPASQGRKEQQLPETDQKTQGRNSGTRPGKLYGTESRKGTHGEGAWAREHCHRLWQTGEEPGRVLNGCGKQNYHKLGGLKWQKFIPSQYWRLKSKMKVSARLGPSGGSEEDLFHGSLQRLVASPAWCSLACSCLTSVYASTFTVPSLLHVCVSPSLSLMRIPVMTFGPTQAIPDNLFLSGSFPYLSPICYHRG